MPSNLPLEMRLRRMAKRLEELDRWVPRETVALADWTLDGAPVVTGHAWQDTGTPLAFAHPQVQVPAHWVLEETRVHLWLGGEGLVRLIGDRTDSFGLNPWHMMLLPRQREFRIEADCVARLPQGVPNPKAALGLTELVWVEKDLDDLIRLFRQVCEMLRALGGHEVEPWPVPTYFPNRKTPHHGAPHAACKPVMDLAEAAFHMLDWPTETTAYLGRIRGTDETQSIWLLPATGPLVPLPDKARQSVIAARDFLRAGLKSLQTRFPQEGTLAATGHAHIDLAWLWPMVETRRKAVRTFHTAIQYMDQFPEFQFNHSTAQLYDFIGQDDPALLAAITEKVRAGQWEPIGAMWVEPDTNMPSGESLVRQLLYGIRWFDKQFGKRSTVLWLPDVFGFSPVLPQLLRSVGMTSVFTIKTNWSEINKLPHDLFAWQGLDGSEVIMHTFENPADGYNAEMGPRATLGTWANYQDKELHPESLLCYGHGDGGGGVTEDYVLRLRQMQDFPVVPKITHVNVSDWFAGIPGRLTAPLPKWVGEIYLEYHRGTLTTQSRTKYLHRRAERALVTAEVLSSMAQMRGANAAPSLQPDWQVLLRNEFHDILPGSSIREVYEVAEAELAGVVAAGLTRQNAALDVLAAGFAGDSNGMVIVNPDLSPRVLRLHSSEALPGGQAVEGGSVLTAPALIGGLSVLAVKTGALPLPAGLSVSSLRLENDLVKVRLNTDGTLASLYDKRVRRECLAGEAGKPARGNQIWAYVDKPRYFDAWDIEEDYAANGQEVLALGSAKVVETGPHRVAVRIERRFGSSTITQTIRLWANSARVEIKTDLDWHDRRILLKSRTPLAVHADHATFECACGVIRRPTHRNTPWDAAKYEVAGHRFADLSEAGFGVALLNDGKYGHDVLGNVMGLSLLRSPVFPDLLADEGKQSFTYALLPHAGDWFEGGVLAEAEDLNQPLLVRSGKVADQSWTAARLSDRPLALSALKPAEDGGDLILRVYEPSGGRSEPALTLPEGWTIAGQVNLLEEKVEGDLTFAPFQIRSLRLTRKP
ncbi:MAG: alpha-mannosidase [Pseudorhodobacter sp.]|nr:alpha-mannosidase [Pseudorhodobacter sp.]